MISQVRYQVFISSTYDDLREERQQATQAILEIGCFPSGMELFPASDDTQWELIKHVIEESDYYIVIVAGRYGSVGPDGISYTEMEYDYAVEKGIPVLGFVRDRIGEVASHYVEQTESGRNMLETFRQKVMSRTCRKYLTASKLGMAVMKSLMAESRVRPRIGWVRADQARSNDDVQRERELSDELNEANKVIGKLERTIRDGFVLFDEISSEELAQGDDLVEITVTFTDRNKSRVSENVQLTWDEIFKVIGPSMYGYIFSKRNQYGQPGTYQFQDDLEKYIATKLVHLVQNRRVSIQSSQMDAFILQFKELGLLMFDEKEGENGATFRGVTLTPTGERRLTLLNMRRRKVAGATFEGKSDGEKRDYDGAPVSRA